jgi:uncharacterized protein (DUF1800 family)
MMTTPQKSLAAAIAANRFGLGARPGELDHVERDPQGWLRRQLKGAPPVLAGDGLASSAATLRRAIEVRKDLAEARRERRDGEVARADAARKLTAIYPPI